MELLVKTVHFIRIPSRFCEGMSSGCAFFLYTSGQQGTVYAKGRGCNGLVVEVFRADLLVVQTRVQKS